MRSKAVAAKNTSGIVIIEKSDTKNQSDFCPSEIEFFPYKLNRELMKKIHLF